MGADLVGRLGGLRRQRLHLLRHHGESLPVRRRAPPRWWRLSASRLVCSAMAVISFTTRDAAGGFGAKALMRASVFRPG
jgi:hypothetical protein